MQTSQQVDLYGNGRIEGWIPGRLPDPNLVVSYIPVRYQLNAAQSSQICVYCQQRTKN